MTAVQTLILVVSSPLLVLGAWAWLTPSLAPHEHPEGPERPPRRRPLDSTYDSP